MYAMPKEQYLGLSFNLVSLYEAISLHVSDKTRNTGLSNGVANGNIEVLGKLANFNLAQVPDHCSSLEPIP